MKFFKEWIGIKTVQKQLIKWAIVLGVIAVAYYAWQHWPTLTGWI